MCDLSQSAVWSLWYFPFRQPLCCSAVILYCFTFNTSSPENMFSCIWKQVTTTALRIFWGSLTLNYQKTHFWKLTSTVSTSRTWSMLICDRISVIDLWLTFCFHTTYSSPKTRRCQYSRAKHQVMPSRSLKLPQTSVSLCSENIY